MKDRGLLSHVLGTCNISGCGNSTIAGTVSPVTSVWTEMTNQRWPAELEPKPDIS